MKKEKPKILVILGPTATGKSALAVKLAKKFNGEVISADSRQVYKGLDIGTGKITPREMRGIKHHLLDIANPKKIFTVVQYKGLAEQAISEILSKGKVPIICGGTGFYIDTLINGIEYPDVTANHKLRKVLATKSAETLFVLLNKIDKRRASKIDSKNKVRLIRAIEIATALGTVPAVKKTVSPYDIFQIGLTLPEEELKRKITIRLFARIRDGMLAEAKRIHAKGLSWKRMHGLGLEYHHLAKFLRGEVSKYELIEKLNTEIWRYARRQMTWFKRDKNTKWYRPDQSRQIERHIKHFLSL